MKKGYLHRVVVEVEPKERQTESGLLIKESKDLTVLEGIVRSVGSSVEEIIDGSLISFQKFDGVELEKNIYSVLDEKILAIN